MGSSPSKSDQTRTIEVGEAGRRQRWLDTLHPLVRAAAIGDLETFKKLLISEKIIRGADDWDEDDERSQVRSPPVEQFPSQLTTQEISREKLVLKSILKPSKRDFLKKFESFLGPIALSALRASIGKNIKVHFENGKYDDNLDISDGNYCVENPVVSVRETPSGLKFDTIPSKTVDTVRFDDLLVASLMAAVQGGHIDVVNHLVTSYPELATSQDGPGGATPLHHACSYGNVVMVKFFVDLGCPINARRRGGATPLHESSIAGHLPINRLLIDRGARIETRDCLGLNSLHKAAENGHLGVCSFLLSKGIDVGSRDLGGQSSLHKAAFGGQNHIVSFLIQSYSVGVNDVDLIGRTPLHLACIDNHLSTTQLLVEKFDAKLDAKDIFGNLPIHWTAICGHKTIFDYLEKSMTAKGLSTSVENELGQKPNDLFNY